MRTTYRGIALVAFGLLSFGNAHLTLKTPVPFGKATLNTSPLNDVAIGSSTSDFPCKQRPGVYDITQMNNMKVGDAQTLNFEGSASHGGGTCQLAVSLDKEPTANSTWKLIQVYEGGCPTSGSGNGGTDTFTYKIPENFPNGVATLAWTWYNKIGNREIYMNCAPITVTGGADNNDYYNTLPNMYVVNLPHTECGTVESTNAEVPNPGQFILKGDTANKVAAATGSACAAAAAAQTQGVQNYQSAPVSTGAGLATGPVGATESGTSVAATATANNGLYSQPSAVSSAVQSSKLGVTTAVATSTTAIDNGLYSQPSAAVQSNMQGKSTAAAVLSGTSSAGLSTSVVAVMQSASTTSVLASSIPSVEPYVSPSATSASTQSVLSSMATLTSSGGVQTSILSLYITAPEHSTELPVSITSASSMPTPMSSATIIPAPSTTSIYRGMSSASFITMAVPAPPGTVPGLSSTSNAVDSGMGDGISSATAPGTGATSSTYLMSSAIAAGSTVLHASVAVGSSSPAHDPVTSYSGAAATPPATAPATAFSTSTTISSVPSSSTASNGATSVVTVGSTGTSSTSSSSTCSLDGAIVCNGPTQFGICNFGAVIWQPVAAGTTCSNGVIVKRSPRSLQLGRWFGT